MAGLQRHRPDRRRRGRRYADISPPGSSGDAPAGYRFGWQRGVAVGRDGRIQPWYAWFGDIQPIESPTTVNLRFPGQYADVESGLYYNWNRYYDPNTGRYITSDSVGLLSGLNSYAYGFNNPTLYSDPWGLWSLTAHRWILREFVLRSNGFGSYQGLLMWLGSLFADTLQYHQNHMHSMRDNETSREEACRETLRYIERQRRTYGRRLALSLASGGVIPAEPAYFALGLALHAVMDAWSPAHIPFQIYEPSDVWRHGNGRRSEESLDDLMRRPDLHERMLEDMDRVLRGERPQLPGCECDGGS